MVLVEKTRALAGLFQSHREHPEQGAWQTGIRAGIKKEWVQGRLMSAQPLAGCWAGVSARTLGEGEGGTGCR